MKHALLFIVTLCLAISSWAQEDLPVVLNDKNIPADFPLRMLDGERTAVGIIYDFQIKPVTVRLKNISAKPIVLARYMSGCSCIELTQDLAGLILKPQQEVPLQFKVYGSRLESEPFTRFIRLDVKDYPRGVRIRIRGVREQKLTFSPAQLMDLGESRGQATWVRTFTISHKFAEDQLVLLPPVEQNDQLFAYTITRIDGHSYKLDIRPKKLPLPTGRHARLIKIPVKGVPHYGPVQLSFKMTVKRDSLHLEHDRITIAPQTVASGKPHVVSTIVKYRQSSYQDSFRSLYKPRKFTRRLRSTSSNVSMMPVSVEEGVQYPLDSQKTWEFIAKNLSVEAESSQPKVTFNLQPEAGQLIIQTIFPEEFFKHTPKGVLRGTVRFAGEFLGNLVITW